MVEQASLQISAGETAVVVGAGLAGLLAAAALSDFFKNVVVVERDRLPTRPGLRKGVPQGAHVHTLLGYAVEAFDQLVPGMIGRLYEAGAVRIRRNQDIWFHDMVGPTPIRDVGILTPSVTRPLLEQTKTIMTDFVVASRGVFSPLYAAWFGSRSVLPISFSKAEDFNRSRSRSPDAACARRCSAISSADTDLLRWN
jgi:hypothetical protein